MVKKNSHKSKVVSKKKKFNYTQLSSYSFIGILGVLVGIIFSSYHPKSIQISAKIDQGELAEVQTATLPKDIAEFSKKQVLGVKDGTKILIPAFVHVPILMFHYVEYVQDKGDTIRISLNTPPLVLDNEIKTLSDNGYTFMTNAELADAMDGKIVLPKSPIVLTFDDGYGDFYTEAYPILKKYHAKATEYIISGVLNRLNYMTTDEVKQIATDGLVEIGAHTVDHLSLKGRSYDSVVNEITRSKDMLENLTGKSVVSFAYPYGAFDLQAMLVAKNSGFTSSVSTLPGIDQSPVNQYYLYRLRPGGRTGVTLLSWLQSVKNN